MSPQPKVLLLTSELFPEFGYPTAGGGVRAQQLYHLLQRAGCDTMLGLLESSARDKQLPEWSTRFLYRPDLLDSLVERANPDWVVSEGWEPLSHLRLEDHRMHIADCPGPLVLENCLSRKDSLLPTVSHKVRTLAQVDAVLCPNEPMRHYLGAFLTLAGWQPSQTHRIIQLPIALPDEIPTRKAVPAGNLSIFMGGITWAWHRISAWLPELADTLQQREIGHLLLRMGKHPHHDLDESVFESLDRRLLSHPAVTIRELAAWDELLADLSQTHLAIEWGPRNLEREIASTLRVVTYLWSGVPVILRPHLDLAKEIISHGAGWVVDSWEELIELLARLSKNPGEIEQFSHGAQCLARECHTYSALASSFPAPLLDLIPRDPSQTFQDHAAEILKAQEDLIQSQEGNILSLKELLRSRDEVIGERDRALGVMHREMGSLHREMGSLHREMGAFHRSIHDHEVTIAGLHKILDERDTTIHSLEREIGRIGGELGAAQAERISLIEQVQTDHQDAESYRAIRRKVIYRMWKRITG